MDFSSKANFERFQFFAVWFFIFWVIYQSIYLIQDEPKRPTCEDLHRLHELAVQLQREVEQLPNLPDSPRVDIAAIDLVGLAAECDCSGEAP